MAIDVAKQAARLRAHLAYYERVFPIRGAAYREFKSRVIIPRLHAALAKIDAGTYGICVDCEKEISDERLEAIPGALRCQECQVTNETT